MSLRKEAPLGVFDSGVGGLTVVKEILRQLPHESVFYFGDTAHVPYGSRSPEELQGFAFKITEYLVAQGCKMIIIACNTSTSLAYELLKEKFPVPMIGVIEPAVDKALSMTQNNCIGVLATEATINSQSYQTMLRSKRPRVEVYPQACPAFVPLIEKGIVDGPELEKVAEEYLTPLLEKRIDTLILGCTHYPFLEPVLRQITGSGVVQIDPAAETVRRAKKMLQELALLAEAGNEAPVHRFFASHDAPGFGKAGSVFLSRDLGKVKEIRLD
ncbi:MAG TPA: glutamate racemase [Peptococcaceae bacterium]|jgi:glutamate racemase|nr:glutamate racemase [Clostridia bacterium]HOB82496.1 glutamate racemase [Peptococcaceae bacterium]HPZ71635.1 glutamate racemase [Peptococcaceae bacterium]HQD54421.1 glutamate racemase [Peptococcaceae bacterium]